MALAATGCAGRMPLGEHAGFWKTTENLYSLGFWGPYNIVGYTLVPSVSFAGIAQIFVADFLPMLNVSSMSTTVFIHDLTGGHRSSAHLTEYGERVQMASGVLGAAVLVNAGPGSYRAPLSWNRSSSRECVG